MARQRLHDFDNREVKESKEDGKEGKDAKAKEAKRLEERALQGNDAEVP